MTGEKTKIHGWQEQFDLSGDEMYSVLCVATDMAVCDTEADKYFCDTGDELGFIIKCLQARVDFLARLLLNEVSEYFQSEIDYLTPIIAKMSV